MAAAIAPHRPAFITPMAAVAGAVADEILAHMTAAAPLARAYVNDGGDIALHLAPGETLTAAGPATRTTIAHADPVRGIATSGWRGRSFSLGIADAVTVLAATAAEADAAATMIANAVDLPHHPAISRAPANALQHDTDLGSMLVTTAVGPLSASEVARALDFRPRRRRSHAHPRPHYRRRPLTAGRGARQRPPPNYGFGDGDRRHGPSRSPQRW